MKKRFFSMLLVLCLLFTSLPVLAETPVRSAVVINQMGVERRATVYEIDGDMLFSAQDLADFSAHELEITGNKVSFTRGRKTVTVDANKNELTCSLSKGKTELVNPVMQVDGKYYISGAQLLKWLNVGMHFKKGKMFVNPNPVSIWDTDGELSDYAFTVKNCAQIMGISESKVKEILKQKDLNKKGYYDLLDAFFLDQSMTDKSTALLQEQVEVVSELTEYADICIEIFYPSMKYLAVFENIGKVSQKLLRLTMYCSLFQENNTAKLEIMSSLIKTAKKNGNKDLAKAADDISDTYTDFWQGLLFTGADELSKEVKGLLDEKAISSPGIFKEEEGGSSGIFDEEAFSSKEILKAIKVLWVDDKLSSKMLKRYPGYKELAAIALDYCEGGPGTGGYSDLKEYVHHALLYLYATEQSYRVMVQYMFDNRYDQDQIDKMLIKAGKAEGQYGFYLTALAYLTSDRIDHLSHRDDYDLVRMSFGNLTTRSDEVPEVHLAEMMAGLAAFKDMGITDLQWTMLDADGDGAEELFLYGSCSENTMEPSTMILDGSTLGIFTDTDEAYTGVTQSSANGCVYIEKKDSQPCLHQVTIYVWNGQRWAPVMDKEVIDGVSSVYHVGGAEVRRSEYDRAYNALSLWVMPEMECFDFDEVYQEGDAQTIFSVFDEYYPRRAGKTKVVAHDVTGDGLDDRIIFLWDAAAVWQEGLTKDTCFGTETPCTFDDRALTVIVAEDEYDYVRLRVCRLPRDNDEVEVLEDGTLVVSGIEYVYQPFGLPYQEDMWVDDGYFDMTDLLGVGPDLVESTLDVYHEWGEPQIGTAEGEWYGEHMAITYLQFHDDGAPENYVIDLSLNNFYNNPVPVYQYLTSDMPAWEILAGLPVQDGWSEPEALLGYEGDVFAWQHEAWFYKPETDKYYLVTILTTDADGYEPPMSIMFSDGNFAW